MKKRVFIALSTLAIITVSSFGLLITKNMQSNTAPASVSTTNNSSNSKIDHNDSVSVDWAKNYHNSSDAIKDTDLIVIAHAESQKSIVDKQPFDVVSTITTVTIKDKIKNKTTDNNNKLEIYQLGGTLNGVDRTPDEVSLLEPGKDYLLMLKSGGPDNTYTLVGGWQGSVPIEEGKFAKNKNRKLIGSDAIEDAFVGKTLNDVRSDLKK